MDILPLLDEIQTIARNGLAFSADPYDRERYERLLDLATRYYGQALDLPPAEVRGRLAAELGYITPKIGAEAALFDAQGRILVPPGLRRKLGIEEQKVNLEFYNDAYMYDDADHQAVLYSMFIEADKRADACSQCGECEVRCPQNLAVMEWLQLSHELLAPGKSEK